ncbi:hypothetical protein [Actinoplanes aureus]|uniref:Uncharacterized protein n=1 Tax=Actinoplanes aureus TaxID=2792083 RepID=A0A931FWM8_9ACTN|nr:hypothetical protein [Actinoplanes aureus]MBG0561525.1 hypothetical protein [Actinoplanes aureus]
MGVTTVPSRDGRVAHGLAQTLAVWVAMTFVATLFPWAAIGAGLLSSILLGKWHQRHARRDTAVGAFTGVVLWPVLIGAALIAMNVASMAMSDFE